ncbi:hypothetical protein JHK87_029408 [Glycine soja]|nr:hypothetical protein JHK87_029408 [Glycine soja]
MVQQGFLPDVVSYSASIRGLIKIQEVDRALKLFTDLCSRGHRPDERALQGQQNKIMALLSRMSGEDREPNVISYSTLVEGLCRAERPDDALLVWNEMERKGCSPNWIAFMALIYGLCKCCRPTAALHYLRQMEQKDMKPYSFIYIAFPSAFLSDMHLKFLRRWFIQDFSQNPMIKITPL